MHGGPSACGCIREAYDFIMVMPIKPNERVWGALLGACRIHSNMDIGLLAADSLLRLAPKQTGYYVLLSNIYARAGRWADVSMVRSVMESKGIKKLPGVSNAELGIGFTHFILVIHLIHNRK